MSGTKRKLPTKFATPNVKAKQATRTPSKQIQAEARAVVGHGALDQDSPSAQLKETAAIEISSDEDVSEEEDLSEDEANFEADANGDVDMEDEEERGAQAEPSFGDLVLATSTEPINVKDAFETETKSSKKALAMPSGASLGVVLTQALKTNDLALLESCLQTSDLATIRATIQRLDAPLASTLLSLLAARLARRPGRAGSLMVWIQWTLVTHGGYLATQPSLIAKMAELNRIVEERARGLSGLLALKGKLDLLDAQMMLRRSVRDARNREDEDEEEDEDVIYVEGEEEGDSEDEMPGVKVNGTSSKKARKIREKFEDSEGSESEDMPDTFEGMDVDSEEDSDDDEEGLIDDEAESTDDDEGDSEEEVDFEEQDEDLEDSEEDGATVGGQTPGRTPKGKGRRN